MHAGVFLKLLAEHYDVVLCVLQLMPWSKFAQDQQTLSLCTEFIQFRFLFVGTMAYYPNEDAAL